MRVFLRPLPPTLCLVVLAPYCSGSHNIQVTWIRPAGGDVYFPGSHLVGQWTTNAQIVFPSFKLCNTIGADSETTQILARNTSECGTPVNPTVRTDENGIYTVTVTVPGVTDAYSFFLAMEDVSRNIFPSPAFIFSPSGSAMRVTTSISSSLNTSTGPRDDQSPTIASPDKPRHTVSPAAYTVPLSIAGVIVVAATMIRLHHRNKFVSEHQQSEELHGSKPQSTDNLGRLRGLRMWATHLATGKSRAQSVVVEKVDDTDIFTPVYVPYLAHEKKHELRRPRSTTREPFFPRKNTSSVVAASVFKTAASPRIPYPYQPSPVHPQRHLGMIMEADEVQNARINDAVVSHYLQPSHMPTPVPTPM